MNTADAIRAEAKECTASSADPRNNAQDQQIFYVVAIILNGIADKIERHRHVNNGVDDACKQCGRDLRNDIHERIK